MEKIRQYTLECLDYLYAEGVKALVIACNTATATTLEIAQKRYDVPVVGVIDSTARVAAATSSGTVGVIATQATVNSDSYVRAIHAENRGLAVYQQATPLLTILVEAGEFDTRKTESVLEGYLHPLRVQKVDTLVLGCTHYPFLRPTISRLMGPEVKIVECGPSTALSITALMDDGKLERAVEGQPDEENADHGQRGGVPQDRRHSLARRVAGDRRRGRRGGAWDCSSIGCWKPAAPRTRCSASDWTWIPPAFRSRSVAEGTGCTSSTGG